MNEDVKEPRQWSPEALTDGLIDDLKAYGALALLFLVFLAGSGPEYLAVTRSAQAVADDIADLPDAAGQPSGTPAVLTGTIARDTKVLHRSFVAYAVESYHSGGRNTRGIWAVTGGLIQPLRIESGGRHIWISNSDYHFAPYVSERFMGPSKRIYDDWDHQEARPETTDTESNERERGFVAGGTVTAVGTLTADGKLDARYVVAGSRVDVLKRLEPVRNGETEPIMYWCAMIGLGGAGLAVLLFLRARLLRLLKA